MCPTLKRHPPLTLILILTLTLTLTRTFMITQEAKLGDQNKFYFDEKLGRWVEEGGPVPEAEAPLAPPPIIASANASSGAWCLPQSFGLLSHKLEIPCPVRDKGIRMHIRSRIKQSKVLFR